VPLAAERERTAVARGPRGVPISTSPAAAVGSPTGVEREAAPAREPVAESAAAVAAPEVQALVAALADDGIAGNAIAAFARLCALPSGRLDALAAALHARDEQQRVLAAAVLRERVAVGAVRVDFALLAVTVQGLRRDGRVDVRGTAAHPLVDTCARFLAVHAASAREPLTAALGSGDEQQRFLAAFLLALGGADELAPRLARELVPRLVDNDVAGDALAASHALGRLGAAGAAALQPWVAQLDGQGRSLAELVLLDVATPPRDRTELRARAARHRATHVYHDPVIEFDLRRSRVPRW
jgi:hypothetical protein